MLMRLEEFQLIFAQCCLTVHPMVFLLHIFGGENGGYAPSDSV